MPEFSPREVLEELARRERAKAAAGGLTEAIRGELFDKQLAFMDDKSRNKAALCTRRAGKTSMWVRYATCVALQTPRCLIRIWAINRLRAKQLLWSEFKYLFKRHGLDFAHEHMHETELTITFENGSEIRLLGADKDKEVQKKRGDKTILEVVVEAQLFGPYLRSLVDDVVEPCLFDMKGTLCLEGTPHPICVGYWWNITDGGPPTGRWVSPGMTVREEENVGAGWSCHHWSLLDNPFVDQWRGLPNWKEVALAALAEIRLKKRWTTEHPTYVREYLGRWVQDNSALFYSFDGRRNTFALDEVQPWGPGWSHTLGWDLGFKDDMALVVWGWHPARRDIFEAFSWKQSRAGAADVMAQIQGLEGRGFNFVKKVADTGGGGRMYVEEVMSRYSQVFEAAKKTEKYEHVRLFNDDLLTGRIKLQRGSVLAEEMSTLPKDPDWPDPEKPEAAPTEDPRFPNHACDASLYGWRAAYHYLYTEEALAPARGTKEYFTALERELLENVTQRADKKAARKDGRHGWWEPEIDYPGEPEFE